MIKIIEDQLMDTKIKIYKSFITPAIITAAILFIPFIAMQFSNEVNWSFFDFIFAGVFIFGIASIYKLLTRKKENIIYRIATGVFLISILMIIWINGAVGILGTESNPANFLYGGVILTGIFGSLIAQLKSKGMAITLFSMAVVQILVPVIAFIIWKPETLTTKQFLYNWHDYGVWGVIGVNALFVIMFLSSGLLYRYDVKKMRE